MNCILPFLSFFITAASPLMAQQQTPRPPDQGIWQTVILIGVALVFFYLILWRPEQKRRKHLDQKRQSLKKGDRVTAMGIIGTIDKVGENTIILSTVDGSKIEFLKAAVTDVEPAAEKSE